MECDIFCYFATKINMIKKKKPVVSHYVFIQIIYYKCHIFSFLLKPIVKRQAE